MGSLVEGLFVSSARVIDLAKFVDSRCLVFRRRLSDSAEMGCNGEDCVGGAWVIRDHAVMAGLDATVGSDRFCNI